MSKLNRDVLYLVFEEFQDDKNTLHSCLFVNKTWFDVIVPILWKNPRKCLRKKRKPLLNVIISHLSNEIKENLSQDINILQQKPLINYIGFCRYLDILYIC